MKDNLDIDKLFKDKFESFEPTVDPKVWQGIASSVGAAGAGSTGATAIIGWVKSIIIGAVATAVGIGAWIYLDDTAEVPNKSSLVELQNEQPINNEVAETPLVNSENTNTTSNSYEEKENVVDVIEKNSTVNDDKIVQNSDNNKAKGKSVPSISGKDSQSAVNSTKKSSNSLKPDPINTKSVAVNSQTKVDDQANKKGKSDDSKSNKSATTLTDDVSKTKDDVVPDMAEEVTEEEIANKSSFAEIPNVFTPNNDRRNDEFFIESENIKEFYIVIFTKQNMKVYETTDAKFRWDGFDMSGNKAPVGDYNYLIKAVGEDGEAHSIYGQLSIR